MRLICPNCEAQYEVDDSAIPDTGRDVQCSSCGHTWFQLRPEDEAAMMLRDQEAQADSGGEAEEDVAAMSPEHPTGSAGANEGGAAPMADAKEDGTDPVEAGADPASRAGSDDVAGADTVSGAVQRPALDENLLNVLREEAEREANARRAEATTLESQPDLGLGAEPKRPVVQPKSVDGATSVDDEAPATPRKQFPNIDEINSSLHPGSEHGTAAGSRMAEDATAFERRRRGFRIGFLMVLVLALVLLSIYVYAPMLAERMPAAQQALAAYTTTIDGWRLALVEGLDAAVRALTAAISGEPTA